LKRVQDGDKNAFKLEIKRKEYTEQLIKLQQLQAKEKELYRKHHDIHFQNRRNNSIVKNHRDRLKQQNL
jgi:hypothetical protein